LDNIISFTCAPAIVIIGSIVWFSIAFLLFVRRALQRLGSGERLQQRLRINLFPWYYQAWKVCRDPGSTAKKIDMSFTTKARETTSRGSVLAILPVGQEL
jgi:hypothetical protein